MNRIYSAALLACLLPFGATSSHADELPFDFEVLQFRAKSLAAKPYASHEKPVPAALKNLTYDQYRDIRFDPSHAWWSKDKLPFQLRFFHPGFIYSKTVQITELADGKATPIPFSTDLFRYGKSVDLDDVPGDVGFTGVKILTAFNTAEPIDELAVFQGASYFRALGKKMRYGLSARGLAINTGEPGGEEFPIFEEFWVERPGKNAEQVVVYALLDSPSAAGAYRFTITPGAETIMQVKTALYFREKNSVKTLGLAPLTSMFWFGENSASREGDLRPEVHDSDGLMIQRGSGEWLWRPLTNPKGIRIAAFADENPKGFGLVQRDRAFESYQDLEAEYNLRASAWVEPIGHWGRGSIRLVELPTPDETNDNIVAFWTPEVLPPAGLPLVFEYKLHWFMEGATEQQRPPSGYVVATREGFSKTHEPELRRFWVDFDGQYLHNTSDSKIEAVITVGEGASLEYQAIQKNPYNGTWRASFAIKPDGSGKPVELRCFLKREPHILTETWSHLWNP
jgi:glucans biosynthesis protein